KAERLEAMKNGGEKVGDNFLDGEEEEVRGKFKTKGFWLAKFPVTQEQWIALMGHDLHNYFTPTYAPVKEAGITDTSQFPTDYVSWDDCQDFLKKLNKQVKVPATMDRGKFVLPHEDEWEYACRGGKGNKQAFYFGDRLNGDLANCNGNFPYGTDRKGDYKER